MKILRTKERKVYAGILITIALLISAATVVSFTRVISDTEDSLFGTSVIRNSDGKYYSATNTNLQLAIDSMPNGGTVWLPSNTTITITTEISMGSNITLVGGGYSTLLYLGNGANCDIIDITTEENIIIEKIRFDGNNVSNGDYPLIDIQSAGAGNSHTKNITIRDCCFFNCGTSMVDVHYDDNTWNLVVEDCYFNGIERDTGSYPAGVWMSGFNAVIRNNYFEDTFGSGVVIEAASAEAMAQNIIIDGNFVTGFTGYGILLEGGGDTANCTVINNHIWDLNSTSYLAPESSYSTGIRCTGNSTIANNYVYNVYRHGIYADGHYIVVTGNIIDKVRTKEGIQISGNSTCSNNIIKNIEGGVGGAGRGIRACNEWFTNTHFVITNNFIVNVDSVGIHIDASAGGHGSIQRCIVSNNFIDTCVGDGIDMYDVENSSVMGNTFANYGGLAIDEDVTCFNNTFIGNIAVDVGNDYDFDGGGSAVGFEILGNVGQIA